MRGSSAGVRLALAAWVVALAVVTASTAVSAAPLALGQDVPEPDVPHVRLAGADRIATAVEASRHGWAQADVALLATAGAFPDALAGAALAARLDAPMLLTPSAGLPPAVADELVRLDVGRVVLLGGRAAIGDAVAADVRALDPAPAVERIAGATRYQTAAAIADAVAAGGRSAVLASGAAFPDALAAASLTATGPGAPILLTEPDALPAVTRDALVALRGAGVQEVVLLGGPAAVGDAVAEAVAALGLDVRRLSGATRYETALAVVADALADPAGAPARPLVISTGEGFADALAAGALTARLDGVFTTVPTGWPQALHAELRQHADRLDAVVVVGGPQAVAEPVVDGVRLAVGDGPWVDDPLDPLGIVSDLRYTQAFTRGEDPWRIWACTIPQDTADTTIGDARLPVDLDHVLASAQALAAGWAAPLSAGTWRPTFAIGGTVTVPPDDPWVRGGCVHEALRQLPEDTGVRGVLVVMDAVGGLSVGGATLFDTCDEARCGVDRSVHASNRHAVLTADAIADIGGVAELALLGHELGHAMGWPHVYRPNPEGFQYEDPMDLMAAAPGRLDDEGRRVLPPGTMAFNRYAAGWIAPSAVAVHRGGTATYEVSPLGAGGVQLIAVPSTEEGALVTLEARVLEGMDRSLPTEGVQVGVVDQRGYPCGAEVGTCAGYRRMAPAMGRANSVDHVLAVGAGADVLGLRIDVTRRTGSTFTVTVSGGPPTIPPFTDG